MKTTGSYDPWLPWFVAVGLLVGILPALALAQGKAPPSTSSGGISRVTSLGACNTAADGRVVWLSTANAIYACDGVAWHWVWTEREGFLPNADAIVPARTVVLHAPDGTYALLTENNAKLDLGASATDEVVSDGLAVLANSWKFNDVSVDVLANRTTNGSLFLSIARNLVLLGSGTAPADHCTSGADAGGLKNYVSDGNRLYYCDGTASYRVSRVLTVPVTFDFPSVPNGTCTTSDVTVAGAAVGDTVSVNADFALPATIGIGNVRSTATNTVTLRLCNHDPTNAQDPASGIYRFRIER